MKIIEVDSLTKYYEERTMFKKKRNRGIENITFDVNKGEIFGFLGPNGAGKTTTMRILLDLLRPTSGKAKIFGKDSVEESKIIKEQLGYIPGDINFYKAMTGGELLAYYEQLYGLPAPLKDELVKYFDIPLNRIVNGYSKGMKQKLAIIQAFMHDPDLVIMDEPTTGLDPLVQQKFYDFLISQKKRGKTIFLSTHILAEAQKVCDRVAIIRNGKIVAIENVAEILARSGKIIKVRFKEAVTIDDLKTNDVRGIIEEDGTFTIHVYGDINSTLKKISSHPVEDIKIGESTLEDIFITFYNGERND